MAKERDEFGDNLKDLKNLRKQLYSAAQCFEASYSNNSHNHKQFVVESCKEYVAKAVIRTVDHLGCAAYKINRLLDEKTAQFSPTNIQISLIQQRLSTVEGFKYTPHSMFKMAEASSSNHQKHLLLPERLGSIKSSAPLNGDSGTVKKAARMKPPVLRKEEARKGSSPNPPAFSFTNQKGPGKRSISPLRLPLSLIKRAVSPTPSKSRRAVSAGKTRESREKKTEAAASCTKTSNHLFRALLTLQKTRPTVTKA